MKIIVQAKQCAENVAKRIKSMKKEIKLKRNQSSFGYIMLSSIVRPSFDPILNPFGKDSYLATTSTIFNGQRIILVQAIGKRSDDELHTCLDSVELDLDKEITKYKLMLSIDEDYKLHENHTLINPQINVI